MPTMRGLVLLLAGTLVPWMAAGGQQAGLTGDPWRLVHPQAKWILGVDWGRARNSAAAQILQRQFAGAQTTLSSTGMGLGALTSVERIIASGLALEGAMKEAPEGFIVAIEGKIDRSRLKKELPPGTAMEKFRGADLFVPPKAKPNEPLLAVVGDGLMLMGDRKALNLVLSGKGGVLDADLAGRAARLASESEIWIAATVPPEKQPQRAGNPDPLQGLERVEMGISLRDGLRLTALLAADTEQSAQNMAGLAQFAGMMGGENSAASWLRQLRVVQKGKEVALSMDVPAKDLERSMRWAKRPCNRPGRKRSNRSLAARRARCPRG